jgi:peptidyl-prolyl cis-trans isomerase C
MRLGLIAAAVLVVPAAVLAQQQLPTKPEPKAEAAPAAKPEPKAEAAPAAKPAAKSASKNAVATVNGVAVPGSRMEMLIQQQAARGMQDNEQMRAMVRDELINREVVAQEAQRRGMAKSPEVQAQVDLARQEILVSAYIRDWVRRNPITDADVQKEYDKARNQAGDKEYRARHILVETEDQAKGVIADLKKGGKFDELAAKNSKDPGSKDRGGDLDWNVPGAYDRQFSDAMVKLEKGKYTEAPVRTRYGFHVIQLDDVRSVKFPPLAEVRPRIQQQLVQNKVEELIRGLRAKAKVE